MTGASGDVWEVMATARTIRRFTDEPVDDITLARCLEAARWAPSGANAQGWRFVVLRSPEQRAVVAKAAAHALEVIEPVYGMTRPADDDNSRRARTYRATYELHDRAGEFTSVLFAQQHYPTASELLLGGSIFPAMQNFLLAARAQGLGACLTSWASYGGERLLRDADRRTRGLDGCRPHRGGVAQGQARAGSPPPACRVREPRPLGRAGRRPGRGRDLATDRQTRSRRVSVTCIRRFRDYYFRNGEWYSRDGGTIQEAARMLLEFDADQRLWQDTVRDVITKQCPPSLVRSVAEDGVDPSPLWKSYVDQGWTELNDPASAVELAIVLEELGRATDPTPFLATMSQFAPLAADRFDPHESGTAVFNGVSAHRDAEGWVLDGTARHVLDGDRVDRLAVVTDAGVFIIAAEAGVGPALCGVRPGAARRRPVLRRGSGARQRRG